MEEIKIEELLVPRDFIYNARKKRRKSRKLAAKRKKKRNESLEESYIRQEKDRVRTALARLNESPEQRHVRLERDRSRKSSTRKKETKTQRERRLEQSRIYAANARLNEDPEKRKARLERGRIYAAESRLLEDAEKRRIRLERGRMYAARSRRNEDPEKKRIRQERARVYAAKQRLNEDPEKRRARLERARIYAANARLNTDPEKRRASLEAHINKDSNDFDSTEARLDGKKRKSSLDCNFRYNANPRKGRQKQNSMHMQTLDKKGLCEVIIVLDEESNSELHDTMFTNVLVPESKPSPEYLEKIRRNLNLEMPNHINIKSENPKVDDFYENECEEIIIPDNIDPDEIRALEDKTILRDDGFGDTPILKVHQNGVKIKQEMELTVKDVHCDYNEPDVPDADIYPLIVNVKREISAEVILPTPYDGTLED